MKNVAATKVNYEQTSNGLLLNYDLETCLCSYVIDYEEVYKNMFPWFYDDSADSEI